jgi:hypothetical protein
MRGTCNAIGASTLAGVFVENLGRVATFGALFAGAGTSVEVLRKWVTLVVALALAGILVQDSISWAIRVTGLALASLEVEPLAGLADPYPKAHALA